MKQPTLIGTKQVAEYFDVSQRTIQRWRKDDPSILPPPVVNKRFAPRWSLEEILSILKKRQEATESDTK